jgi:hypothetical protein
MTSSDSSPRGLTTFLAGVGVGAAIMYLFDLDAGTRRRALEREALIRAGILAAESPEGSTRTVPPRRGERGAALVVSDEALVARVRAELAHHATDASALEISAQDGVVALVGLVHASEIESVLACVRGLRGVERVDNRLQLRGSSGGASFDRDISSTI